MQLRRWNESSLARNDDNNVWRVSHVITAFSNVLLIYFPRNVSLTGSVIRSSYGLLTAGGAVVLIGNGSLFLMYARMLLPSQCQPACPVVTENWTNCCIVYERRWSQWLYGSIHRPTVTLRLLLYLHDTQNRTELYSNLLIDTTQ